MAVDNKPYFAIMSFLTGMGALMNSILGNWEMAILCVIANLIACLGAFSR
jgi:hypothetical protein